MIIVFGTWIQLSPAGTWAWPPSVLALLMTLVVVLGVPWAAFEAAWALAECLRAQGVRPQDAIVMQANGHDGGKLATTPDSRAFQLGREVERRAWERMRGGS